MAVITSDPFLLGQKSFVTETDGNTANIKRTGTKAITQTEKEIAGDYYNSTLDEINYAEIYNLNFGANFMSKLGASDEWMATALTDPTYKDAFKKATGKDGPNISFASIADSNLKWEPTPVNRDANNKSTSGGKFVGRYPLNQDRKQYDYLQVTALEYKPSEFGSKGGITEEAEARDMHPVGNVYLPMQPGLQDNNNTSWQDDKLDFITAALANISGSTVKGASKGAQEAAKQMGNAMGSEWKKVLDSGDLSNEVAGYFAEQATGAKVLTRTTGSVINPNLELLFDGPSLRSFNYTYRFTPREAEEAQEVRKIIKFFKKNMAPKKGKKGKLFLESPNVFKLKYFFKNGQEHPFLNKIKRCALTSSTVQYTPDGSYMTYDDGSMTAYELSLGFKELNPIYAEEIDIDSNDMGF